MNFVERFFQNHASMVKYGTGLHIYRFTIVLEKAQRSVDPRNALQQVKTTPAGKGSRMLQSHVHKVFPVVALALSLCIFPSCHKKPGRPSALSGAVPGAIELPPEKMPPLLEEASAVQPVEISFSKCDTIGGDLTFDFTQPMAPEDSLKTAKHPPVTFSPDLAGTFAWRSPTRLVFSPAADAMTWGQSFTVTINSAVPIACVEFSMQQSWSTSFEVPYFQMAGKVAGWPIYKGKPRFVAFLNWDNYGEIPARRVA